MKKISKKSTSIHKNLNALCFQLTQDQPGIQKKQIFDKIFSLYCRASEHISSEESSSFIRSCFHASTSFSECLPALGLDEDAQLASYDRIIAIQRAYARKCKHLPLEERAVLETLESSVTSAAQLRQGEIRTSVLQKKAVLGESSQEPDHDLLSNITLHNHKALPVTVLSYHELHAELLQNRASPHATLKDWFDLKQNALGLIARQDKTDASIALKLQQVELALRIVSDYIDFCLANGFVHKIAAPRRSMIRLFKRYVGFYAQTDAPEASIQTFKNKVKALGESYLLDNIDLDFYKTVLMSVSADPIEKKMARQKRKTLIHKVEQSVLDIFEKYYACIAEQRDLSEQLPIHERITFLKHQQVILTEHDEDSISKLYATASKCLQDVFLAYFQIPIDCCLGLIDPAIIMVSDPFYLNDEQSQVAQFMTNLEAHALDQQQQSNIREIILLYFDYKKGYTMQGINRYQQTQPDLVAYFKNDLFVIQTRLEMYRFLFTPRQTTQNIEPMKASYRCILQSIYASAYMKQLTCALLQQVESIEHDEADESDESEADTPSVVTEIRKPSHKKHKTIYTKKDDADVFFHAKDDELMKLIPIGWTVYKQYFSSAMNAKNYERALEITRDEIAQTSMDFPGDSNLQLKILFDLYLDKFFVLQASRCYADAKNALTDMEKCLMDPSFGKIRVQQTLLLLCKQAEIELSERGILEAKKIWDHADEIAEKHGTFCFESIWVAQLKHDVLKNDSLALLDDMYSYLFNATTFILLHEQQWNYFYLCYDRLACIFSGMSHNEDLDASVANDHRKKALQIYDLLLTYSQAFFPNRAFDIAHQIGLNCNVFYLRSANGTYREKAQHAFSLALTLATSNTKKQEIKQILNQLSRSNMTAHAIGKIYKDKESTKQKNIFFKSLQHLLSNKTPAGVGLSTCLDLEHAIQDYFFMFEIRHVLLLLNQVFKQQKRLGFDLTLSANGMMLDALLDLMTDIKRHETNLIENRFKKNMSQDERQAAFHEWWLTEKYAFETIVETFNLFSLIFNETLESDVQHAIQQELSKKEGLIETIQNKIEGETSFTALPTKINLEFTREHQHIFTMESMPDTYSLALEALSTNKPSYALHYLLQALSAIEHPNKRKSSEVLIAYASVWVLQALQSDVFQRYLNTPALKENFVELYQCIHNQTQSLLPTRRLVLFGDTIKNTLQPRFNALLKDLRLELKEPDASPTGQQALMSR
ncbi:MAG: hypothetical protein GW760_01575 [Legionella sp.]|nr:hypothetical protein [Legionella sp.]